MSIGTFTAFMGVHYEYIPDGTGRVNLNFDSANADEEIVFHHDARANHGGDQNVLVLNTKIGGTWQSEMRPQGFPFTPSVNTAVTALSNVQDQVVTYANGNHIADYSIQGGASLGDIKGIRVASEENKHPQLGIVSIGHVSVLLQYTMLYLNSDQKRCPLIKNYHQLA